MRKQSVLVIGSSNTDMIIKVDRLPEAGETVLGGQFASMAGGKGANQAVGAARAGAKVTFITRVGSDTLGENAVRGFRADGINVNYVVRDAKAPSGVALIFIGKDGENSIAVASGANGNLAGADLKHAVSAFESAAVVVLQLEVPLKTVQAAAALAKKAGAPVILNPAPAQPLPASLLKDTFLLTPNQTEAELLTGIRVDDESSAAKAADCLLSKGVRNVIITMGGRGASVAGDGVRAFVPAHKVKAVDTTAAGDIFNGALAAALAEGKTLFEAVQFASAAAAISVTRLGAQPSAPQRKEIEALLARVKPRNKVRIG
jgi:ribokinase